MPFTFSHPALILPLRYFSKKWFSLTGLIVGSIIPDFEYFLRMKIKSDYSHSLWGVFWLDLPLALLIAFLFHNLIRKDLVLNLPICLKSRVINTITFDWNSYFRKNSIIVLYSILIGIGSHLLWDSFTHDNGFFVQQIPFLSHYVTILEYKIPVLKLAQHASTLIGLVVIVWNINKIPQQKNVDSKIDSNYWLLIVSIAIIVVLVKIASQYNEIKIGNVIVSTIAALLLSSIITSYIRKLIVNKK